MSRALLKAYAEWEKAHPGWDDDLPGDAVPADYAYITPGGADSEPYDLRRAVPEPPVGRDGLPVLGKTPRVRDVKFSVFDGVAPAPLHRETDEDIDARLREDARQDSLSDHADAIRARAMREYDGDYPEVLALLLQRKSLAEIALATGYSDKHVRNVVRGNAQRPEAECLCDWMDGFLRSVWQGDVPISVEPVHTKKSLQDQAVVAQMGWDFDAMGVQA
ncbi:hypothetical protein HAP94_08360 [Acidithiobacillus ferrivorans]|nr:hypothetical protein [Acidithiobacillus ferrivorans]